MPLVWLPLNFNRISGLDDADWNQEPCRNVNPLSGGLFETSTEISALQRLQFLVNQEPNLALARNQYLNFHTPNVALLGLVYLAAFLPA
jgi:hypothetical protein